MRIFRARCVLLLTISSTAATIGAQSAPPAQFEVASIKRHSDDDSGGGIRTLPDGTFIMTNQPISSIIFGASPVQAREVEGLPDWANTERYDVTAKPPAGTTRAQQAEMMRSLFAVRMKLVGHVEQRERKTFALVVDRPDGRLGPQLKPSPLNCLAPAPAQAPDAPPPDARSRCGMMMSAGSIVSGGMRLNTLVFSLEGAAGGIINDRTGLDGFYAFTLRFSERRALDPAAALPDDPPDIFTALKEQLGLRLQPEQSLVPIFVVDHIERPTEN